MGERSVWEYGSEFHWLDVDDQPKEPILPQGSILFGSGRDTIRALVRMGVGERGWRRWLLPSYFCQEVTATIAAAGVDVELYEDSPLNPASAPLSGMLAKGDVILLVNYFGLRGMQAYEAVHADGADVVEDHSHDPWSQWARTSCAEYCFASLRKTLPIPDGGALWSPRGLQLPTPVRVTPERASASHLKLSAMLLKRLYLEGRQIEKDEYRRLQRAGEEKIASGPVSGPTKLVEDLLPVLPWDSWRALRRQDHGILSDALRGKGGFKILKPFEEIGSCPFSVILKFDSPGLRDHVRSYLIANSIFPAILWPIESSQERHATRSAAKLSKLLLSIPCDCRYSEDDFLRVAGIIRDAVCVAGL